MLSIKVPNPPIFSTTDTTITVSVSAVLPRREFKQTESGVTINFFLRHPVLYKVVTLTL